MTKMEISVELGENEWDPMAFVDATVFAEEMGFRTAWFGDHIFPWFHSGKRSSFVWSVMAAALERSHAIRVGPWVTVPTGARYHPAIIAQAAATLDNMYPGRIQLGVGSGEALNERPFWNDRWPNWERMDRLTEGIRLMRQMWESKEPFKFDGKFFSSDFYYLYTKPRRRIPVYASAIGKRAAYAAGKYADGLISIAPRAGDVQRLRDVIFPEYRRGRSDLNGQGPGRVALEILFSFDKPEEIVKKSWRTLGIYAKDAWSIPNPIAVEEAGKKVTVEDVKKGFYLCKTWKDLVKVVETFQQIGVNECTFTIGCDKRLIRALAKNVLSVF